MIEFLEAVWGELTETFGELRLMRGGNVQQLFCPSAQAAEINLRHVTEGFDVYFGVLPRRTQRGGGDSIADETSILWADFDGKAYVDGGDEGKSMAFAALRSIPLEPQIVVDSGNGYHAYWLLRETVPFAEAQQVMKGFQLLAGADKTYDKARILRVPGTLNYKTDPPKPVRILRFNLLARKHRIQDFVDYASASMPLRPGRSAQAWGPGEDYEGREVVGWEYSKPGSPKFPEGTRNNSLTSLAGIMYARGMTEDQVVEALDHENMERCDPPLDRREVELIAASIGRLHR